MDAFGQAALDFLSKTNDENITVYSKTMEDDVIPVPHLFRSFDEMPICEQTALQKVSGKVLDVGGGVGSHCLYLQEKGFDATMLDYSQGLCDVATQRGVNAVTCADFFTWQTSEKYDTLLFMMNGIGIGGTFESFAATIKKSFELLNEGGQILFDSTDIGFCYEQEDGSVLVPLNLEYPGFVEFQLEYKNQKDNWFKWAYYDFNKIAELVANEYEVNLLQEDGPAYSAQIIKKA